MRLLSFAFVLASVVAACGGKLDDADGGTDASADSPSACAPLGGACNVSVDCCAGVCIGGVCADAPPTCSPVGATCTKSSECCSNVCDAQGGFCVPQGPPPPCEPDGATCASASQCCSHACNLGHCGSTPPPCKPDGAFCQAAGDCCSDVCNASVCGVTALDGGISCASTSNKQCDQCVAAQCCSQMTNCGSNTTCTQWLSCVQSCEQNGFSAFSCTQNLCGAAATPTENALYSCAQQHCSTECTTD